jgi:hypothetical protein
MPQLPSGRHVALSLAPLEAMAQRALATSFVTELLQIEQREQLFPYVELIYLVPGDGAPVELAPGSRPMPAELQEVPSGLTLATLQAGIATWSVADRNALYAFIASERNTAFLERALEWVQARKRELLDDPRFAVRVQAAWWLAGYHPLQTDGSDEGIP